jgi:glycosyltransferase involved in cell wall biosynthesis
MTSSERVPVLTFLTNFLIGGTERQVINLVRNHDRRRFDVHLACFRLKGPLLHEIENADLSLSEYPISTLRSLRVLWQQFRLIRYLRRHRIQVVHAFGFYANVFAIPAARIARVPVVVASIRDTGDHLTPFQRRLQKWACSWADQVLVNATAVQDVLVGQGYDPSRIGIIHNGIDVARFRRPSGDRANVATWGLGLPPGAPVVAAFARLNRLKGIEYFLEAAAIVAKPFENVRFLIVGDSISQTYREELEALATRLGIRSRVVFAGFRSDVPELLAGVTVSVLPSLSEGLSNVVLEAMAAGVPMVATAVGGTPEMIEDDVTGVLVPPKDAYTMAIAIGTLLGDPAKAHAMGEAARRSVTARFSLVATVLRTEELYERLLRRATMPGRTERSHPLGQPARLGLSPEQPPLRKGNWS